MSWDVSIETDPVVVTHDCPNCGGHADGKSIDFEVNITYNVGLMLRLAGIHPSIVDGMYAKTARPVFTHAVRLMLDNPSYFKRFDSDNKWGTYATTLNAVEGINNALAAADEDAVLRWV
jgi:hypothetical protein